MSEELLKQFPMAMTIDPESGKPMPKVSASGTSSGGSEPFPSDFPDSNLSSIIENHIAKYNSDMIAIKNMIGAIGENLNYIDNHIIDIVDGNKVIKVQIISEEPGESGED